MRWIFQLAPATSKKILLLEGHSICGHFSSCHGKPSACCLETNRSLWTTRLYNESGRLEVVHKLALVQIQQLAKLLQAP